MNVFAVRAGELIQDRPELAAAVAPLLKTREVIERQIADLDRKVMRMARNDIQVRRFMTVPGVRGDHRAVLSGDDRQPNPVQEIAKCWSLCRVDDPTIRLGRDRLDRTHLEMWRRNVAKLPLRGSQRIADARRKMVSTQVLGYAGRQAKQFAQG